MSVKSSVVDLLNQASTAAQAAVASNFNSLITAVNALPDDVAEDVTTLQAQLAIVQGQLDAANQAIAADATTLTAEKSKEAQLQAVIDAVKAALTVPSSN